MTDSIITSSFEGLIFSNSGSPEFTIARLDGWYSGAPVRVDVEERPTGDGAFGVRQIFRSPRVITQSGIVRAADTDSAVNGPWAAFAALQPAGSPSEFSVTDGSGIKSVVASLAAAPELELVVGGLARYTLQLIARDPVKYGPESTVSTGLPAAGGGLVYPLHDPAGALSYGALGDLGRVSVSNPGTADTWPVVVVTGELTSGFFVQCLESGHVVRYDRVVPAGTSVALDFRTGETLIDGQSDGSTYVTRDEWFPIPAGGSCTIQFNSLGSSSGSPMMTVTTRPGWW